MVQRRPVPRAVREQVLKEYKHHCAICGQDHPQLHHIDENPSNNDPLNLIPLCPNCHLTGQHNPHQVLEGGKLQFFRIHKHPFILKPQFHPLFIRLAFLDEAQTQEIAVLEAAAQELVHLIKVHLMGEFYAGRVGTLVHMRHSPGVYFLGDPASERAHERRHRADEEEYRRQLVANRDRVHQLIVEMLAYQQW
jgi:hypothetical protein